MRERSICVPAIAALALAIMSNGLCTGAWGHGKPHNLHKRPHQAPTPVLFIRCAAVSDWWPCGPDPAMQRLIQRPGQVNPQVEPQVEPPTFVPSR